MQNLTTTLWKDIQEKNRIFLPTGKATAAVLTDVKAHQNKAYTIIGHELYHFQEVAEMLSKALGRKIHYISPNLLKFYFAKKKEGVKPAFIFVMIMLHYLPRFQKPPKVSDNFTWLTDDESNTLDKFIVKT